MISALQWVPRGAAKAKPAKFVLSSTEVDMLKAHMEKIELEEQAGEANAVEDASKASAEEGQVAEVEEDGGEEQEEAEADDMEEDKATKGTLDEHGLPMALRMDEYDDDDDLDDAALSANLASSDHVTMQDVKLEMEREDESEDENSDAEVRSLCYCPSHNSFCLLLLLLRRTILSGSPTMC